MFRGHSPGPAFGTKEIGYEARLAFVRSIGLRRPLTLLGLKISLHQFCHGGPNRRLQGGRKVAWRCAVALNLNL
ncbi:hypothetical protein EON65_25805, partial [archaeon]